jgi:hypothetical protein
VKFMHSRYLSFISTVAAISATLLTCFYAAPALADQICDFIALDTVTAKFPQSAPWRVTNGGSGACAFEGEKRQGNTILSVILKFTQQVQDTPAEAVELINTIKPAFAADYDLEPSPKLGTQGFYMLQKGQPLKDTISWWAHRGRTVLSGLMITPGGGVINAADRGNLNELIGQTLALADAPAAQAKATQCPYFDDALLKRLLPGTKLKVQQFGNNSCLAEGDDSVVVMLTRTPVRNKKDFILQTKDEGSKCIVEQPTGLGDAAFLLYACKSGGNPSASLAFLKGDDTFSLSLLPGKEPTAPQRADLAALGRHIYGLK